MSGIQVAPDIEERHGFPGALRESPSPAVFAVGARATAAAAAAAVEAALGPALAAAGTLAAGRFFAEAAAARAAPLALAAARLLAEPAGAAARTIAAEAAARPGTSAARAESRATAAATARAEARAAEAAAGRPVAVGAGTTADWTRGPRAARAARRGLVHADHAPVERGAVERGDGLLRLLGGRHLDEAEAPRASRLSVGHHGGRHHLAEACEGAAQALARGGKRETTDEQLHGHDLLLSFAGSITPSIYPPRNGDLDEMARLFGADLTESLSRSGLRRWGRAAANRPRSARARRARPAQRSHAPAA